MVSILHLRTTSIAVIINNKLTVNPLLVCHKLVTVGLPKKDFHTLIASKPIDSSPHILPRAIYNSVTYPIDWLNNKTTRFRTLPANRIAREVRRKAFHCYNIKQHIARQ
ncbi:hypothetical protein V6N12_011567 [Hibiscus sabdariffa]|uniref:Uncharacterized protein n=1 Tax=Hibiscus sabdariffa TaxID=183260 RepID=A0ABR2AYW4_9ROSI